MHRGGRGQINHNANHNANNLKAKKHPNIIE